MEANKTQPNNTPLEHYILTIADIEKRKDSRALVQIMQDVTGDEPILWGTSIVGFGTRHYRYDSGREGDIMKVGFSARKKALTIYGLLMYDQNGENVSLAKQLGPHDHGKGCLYIKSLAEIDTQILKQMILNAYNSK